jgi:hypothetical protein
MKINALFRADGVAAVLGIGAITANCVINNQTSSNANRVSRTLPSGHRVQKLLDARGEGDHVVGRGTLKKGVINTADNLALCDVPVSYPIF